MDLLKEWLGWKAQELKIKSGGLEQQSREQRQEAAKNRYYAGNVWDNLTKEQKVGSSDTVRSLTDHWRELVEKAEAAEHAAANYEDLAADAKFSSEYYLSTNSDSDLIASLRAKAQISASSFQGVVERRLTPLVTRMQRRRTRSRFIKNVWKWTVRLAIAFVVLLVLGAIGAMQKCAESH